MDVREKLMEIMEDLGCNDEYCKDCEFCNDIDGYVHRQKEIIADRLIANGVTVQENVKMSDELLKQLKNAPITIFKSEPSIVTVHEWISVKERLPEEGEYVLCVLKGFNYGGKIQVCKFVPADKFKDKPYFEHFRNGFPSVTHWMPLPEPPKGE